MPADHGTPNTGDERDKRRERAERHDRAIEAAKRVLFGADRHDSSLRATEAAVDAYFHAYGRMDFLAPARDGTVAVEDVARLVEALDGLLDRIQWDLGSEPQSATWRGAVAQARTALAEFGVSERAERIHDQATKEEEQ